MRKRAICAYWLGRFIMDGRVMCRETQDVARPDPAERSRMTMMARAVRNCKDTIIQEASQRDEIIGIYPVLST